MEEKEAFAHEMCDAIVRPKKKEEEEEEKFDRKKENRRRTAYSKLDVCSRHSL